VLTLGSGKVYAAAYNSAAADGAWALASIDTYYPTTAGTSGLFLIGEVGGDVEFNIEFQEKEFNGQANFPIAKGFYGGKVSLGAKKVELDFGNLKRLLGATQSTGTDNNQETYSETGTFTTGATPVPPALYVRFEHTRSDDPSKKVKIHLWKAFSMKLTYPFTREDIATQDIDFSAIADRKTTSGVSTYKVFTVEVE
jgi:hypothetical protein